MLSRPQQIEPSQPFSISYFLRDHIDQTTYYVQAKIYDIATGVLLKTVELSPLSANDHLYTAQTQAPGDSLGFGREIMVIATVYTDSGYTTKSENHEEQEHVYLVRGDTNFGGGGSSTDPEYLKEVVTEVVASYLEPIAAALEKISKQKTSKEKKIEIPKFPTEEIQKISASISQLMQMLAKVPTKEVDLSTLEKRQLQNTEFVKALLDDEVDLSTIEGSIGELKELVATQITAIGEELKKQQEEFVSKYGEEAMTQLKAAVVETIGKQQVVPMNMSALMGGPAQDKPQKETQPDINNLFKIR